MLKHFKLRKGLDIRLKGCAKEQTVDIPVSGVYAVSPQDFYGVKPKPMVKVGDSVLAGDALFVSKDVPELNIVSPVSGSVVGIVRGELRKLLKIDVESDGRQQYKDFDISDISKKDGNAIKALLLEAGLFGFIRQRPFDIVANPSDSPKAIFISLFSKMPLAQDFSYALKGNERYLQAGVEALNRIAPVKVGISAMQSSIQQDLLPQAEVYVFDGPNPSGNVGVQINHISPVNKGEVVWTIGAEEVIFVGRLILDGKVDMMRTIAVAGSKIANPCYARVYPGMAVKHIIADNITSVDHTRIISGNPLVGRKVSMDENLGARATELTAIPEGDDKDEILGWIMPRLNDFSTSHSYFSWLQGSKEYDLDARIKGGERHIIMSGEYDRYMPMDIYAGHLIKAILSGDLDRMEALGIYEVAPEDFAVAEFADSSKLELQRIVREGLDLLRKEL